jgi:hypothetical protein
MADRVLAAVRAGPGATELREFPMPDIGEGSALLDVEVAGIRGTDVRMYAKPVLAGARGPGYRARAGETGEDAIHTSFAAGEGGGVSVVVMPRVAAK